MNVLMRIARIKYLKMIKIDSSDIFLSNQDKILLKYDNCCDIIIKANRKQF